MSGWGDSNTSGGDNWGSSGWATQEWGTGDSDGWEQQNQNEYKSSSRADEEKEEIPQRERQTVVVGKIIEKGSPVLKVRMKDKDIEIHAKDPALKLATMTDVYNLLSRDYSLDLETERLVKVDMDQTITVENDSSGIELPGSLIVELKPISIIIQHDGKSETLEDISMNKTVQIIREEYKTEYQTDIWFLSYEGKRLEDHQTVEQLGLQNDSVLLGLYSVNIEDKECALKRSVKVCGFHTIQDLHKKYMENSRRSDHAKSKYYIEESSEGLDPQEMQQKSLWDLKILENTTLYYESAQFTVCVKDQKMNPDDELKLELTVFDYFTVAQLKDLFVQQARAQRGIMTLSAEDFKLIFAAQEMKDDKMLYEYGQYRLANFSEIIMQREEEQKHVKYRCVECGEMCNLGPGDTVCCVNGHRIVEKLRTTRHRIQFICR
mmetsp:Transcript_18059/g.28773  ORF Transcript_18059/g.28773 Transcript_18059/m.28773 type:complete len:434 (-) Transcript_18059:140-1441(-)|eukprot:jgi/Bigna1/68195/fgenesh1_pg.5_\